MSQFLHILPMAGAASQDGKGEPTGFSEAQTGVAGLFEELMAQALLADPAKNLGKNQQSPVLIEPPKMASVEAGKAQTQPSSQQNQTNCSNHVETPGKNLAVQLSATASDAPAPNKSITKTGGASKTEKNSSAPAEPVTATVMVTPEITPTQMLAAAISTTNPMSQPTLDAGFDISALSQLEMTIKPAIIGMATPKQGKQISSATVKISSDFSEDRVTPAAQPVTAIIKAGLRETEETKLPVKSSEVPPPVAPSVAAPAKASLSLGPASASSEKSDSSAGSPPTSQPVGNGTSVANQNIPMKQVEKANKIAGQTEKVLPGNAISAVRGSSTLAYSSHAGQLTGAVAAGIPVSGNVEKAATAPVDAITTPAANNMRGTVERTEQMVTLNAVRLSDSGNSSMQVVIKPDAGTQLSLQLRQQGGGVEVQAVLQQGDFHHLSQQWPDLQHRLDQRGIRLAPLSDEGAAANNGGSNETFQQQQNQTADIVPDITLVESPAGILAPEAAQAPAHRGWETWA